MIGTRAFTTHCSDLVKKSIPSLKSRIRTSNGHLDHVSEIQPKKHNGQRRDENSALCGVKQRRPINRTTGTYRTERCMFIRVDKKT